MFNRASSATFQYEFQLSTTNYGLDGSLDVDKTGELSLADMAEQLGVRGVKMEAVDFKRLTENGVLCNQSKTMCQDQFHKVGTPNLFHWRQQDKQLGERGQGGKLIQQGNQ
jgi:hypothetical protein